MNEARYRDIISGRAKGVGPSLLRLALNPISWLFSIAARMRLAAYKIGLLKGKRAPIPVICVGNLTAGGSGKTPMVIAIAQALEEEGHRVAVVSRGYRSLESGENDESLVIKESVPNVILVANPDRHAGVVEAAKAGAEVVLLDDGFSHLRLKRDLDILLFDATAPFGHKRMLPRGLLREPLSSAKRAKIGVVTRSGSLNQSQKHTLARKIKQLGVSEVLFAEHQPSALVGVSAEGLSLPLGSIKGKKVVALCGIANPQAFQATLERLGAKVTHLEALADHFSYPDEWIHGEWPRLCNLAKDGIVMTQKDAVKLRGRLDDSSPMALELQVEMSLAPEELKSLIQAVKGVIERL